MFDTVTISKYAGIAFALLAAGFGAPIPEEIPIVTAGAMAGNDAQEKLHDDLIGAVGGGPAAYFTPQPENVVRWWIMLPIIIVAVVAGDTVLFMVGRIWGAKLLRSGWVQRNLLPPDKVAKIAENFHKNGIMILLGARLTPGIRTPVFLMAGILHMPLRRFLLADILYAVPGVNILFWLSYLFTDQFVAVIKAAERHRAQVIVGILCAVAGVIVYKFVTSRKLSTGDVDKIPTVVKPVAGVTQMVEKAVEKTVEKTIEKTAQVVDKVRHRHRHDADADAPSEPSIDVPAAPQAPADAPK